MAKSLDHHFKCPKSLKTIFALRGTSGSLRAAIMAAEFHATHTEYAVQNHVVPLPKQAGERPEKPKKKFGAEKYDQRKAA